MAWDEESGWDTGDGHKDAHLVWVVRYDQLKEKVANKEKPLLEEGKGAEKVFWKESKETLRVKNSKER